MGSGGLALLSLFFFFPRGCLGLHGNMSAARVNEMFRTAARLAPITTSFLMRIFAVSTRDKLPRLAYEIDTIAHKLTIFIFFGKKWLRITANARLWQAIRQENNNVCERVPLAAQATGGEGYLIARELSELRVPVLAEVLFHLEGALREGGAVMQHSQLPLSFGPMEAPGIFT